MWHTMRYLGSVAVFLIMAFLTSATAARSGTCEFMIHSFEQSGLQAFTNTYRNVNYAYLVTIPSGLVGYSSPAPSPQHGLRIAPEATQHTYIFVDAERNSLDYLKPRQVALWHLK